MNQYLERAQRDALRFTVVGASGFIGSRLSRHLRKAGLTVVDIGRNHDFAGADLGYVFYCAGMTADYAARPLDTVDAHVGTLSDLLHHASYRSLVYLSSTRLYDSGPDTATESNDLIVNPDNRRHLFDISKALGECLSIQASNGLARVARLSSVYSADLGSNNYLHELIRTALAGKDVVIPANPLVSRDYVDVEDVMPALIAIALAGKHRIYNVASGENVSNEDVLRCLAELSGTRMTATGRQTVARSPLVDISTMRADFGFEPALIRSRLPGILATNKA